MAKDSKGLGMAIRKITPKIRNIKQLHNELLEVFVDLKNGDIDLLSAQVINNNVGKIIKLMRVEMDYYATANRLVRSKFIEGR